MSVLSFSFPIAQLAALQVCVDLTDSGNPRVNFDSGDDKTGSSLATLPGTLKLTASTTDGRRLLRLSVEPAQSSALPPAESSTPSNTHTVPMTPSSLPPPELTTEYLFSQPNTDVLFSNLPSSAMYNNAPPPQPLVATDSTNIDLSSLMGNLSGAPFSYDNPFPSPSEFWDATQLDSDISVESLPMTTSECTGADPMEEDESDKLQLSKDPSPCELWTDGIPSWLAMFGVRASVASCPTTSDVTSATDDAESLSPLPTGPDADCSDTSSVSSRTQSRSRPSQAAKPYQRRKKTVHNNPELYTFECSRPGCDRKFRCQYTRDTHEKSHNPKQRKSFSCDYEGCDETFTRAHDRLRHEVAQHGKTCEYTCDKCSRFFSSEMMLSKHRCPRPLR